MRCHLLTLQDADKQLHLLSPFTQEELQTATSRSELFIGTLIDPQQGVAPGNIAYNRDFLVHVHALVRDEMVNHEDVIAQAKEQPNGFVFIIDRRSPVTLVGSESTQVDKEDIIGIFLCNDQTTSREKYRPNPDYVLISNKGVAQFPEAVESKIAELITF